MAALFPFDLTGALRDAIVSGRYQPNEHLIEEELARAFGTNRAAIRTALSLLEGEGLVVRERNRGARVRLISPQEATEILEVRALLEGHIARRVAERADGAAVAQLEAIVAEMRERASSGDLLAYSRANATFHRTLIGFAEHETAAKMLDVLHSQIVRYQFRTVLHPGRSTASMSEHEAILAAIRAKDGEAAERAMRAHIANVIATVRLAGAELPNA